MRFVQGKLHTDVFLLQFRLIIYKYFQLLRRITKYEPNHTMWRCHTPNPGRRDRHQVAHLTERTDWNHTTSRLKTTGNLGRQGRHAQHWLQPSNIFIHHSLDTIWVTLSISVYVLWENYSVEKKYIANKNKNLENITTNFSIQTIAFNWSLMGTLWFLVSPSEEASSTSS